MPNVSIRGLGLVGLSFLAGVGMTMAVQSGLVMEAQAMAEKTSASVMPETWTAKGLNAMKLGELPEIDWITVESGSLVNSETMFYEGDNIVLAWEGGPAKLLFEEPSTYEEFVIVLKGELILTDTDGNSATYRQGDMFMLPKGFAGTWEMTEEYRELIVVDAKDYNAEY